MMQVAMIIVAFFILVGLVWMEIKRPARSFLALRILASIAASLALLLLVVPIPISSTNMGKHEILVLSDGYSKDSVDQFLKKSHQSFPQFHLNTISYKQLEGVDKIHLFGYGFTDTNQVPLPNIPIQFHASDPQTGIQTIHWQETLVAGTPLHVQGNCLNVSNKAAKLVLYGWNKRIDSITMEANKLQPFSFSVVPENEGRGFYHLSLLSGKDSIENETIAYQVLPAKALKVLMLGDSPDFEAKFLKNWLADFGYTVRSKTSVSIDKFQQTVSNGRPESFDKLTTTLLEEQDLIFSDEAALQTLSATELVLLKQNIAEKGLGLILNTDTAISKKNFLHEIFNVRSADSNKALIKINRLGESNTTAPIALKHPYQIIEKEGTQPIFMDQQKRVFASVATYGKGKLIVNTLQKTSSWLLSGNKNDYRYYWTTMINRSAKKEMALESWNIQTELPRVNDAIEVEAQSSANNPPSLTVQENEIYPKQNNLLPGTWEGIYWPNSKGWQTMVGTNGALKDWYGYPTNAWKPIYAKKQINQTKAYLKNRLYGETKKMDAEPVESKIPSLYLFLTFLCSMAYLWVERKFQ